MPTLAASFKFAWQNVLAKLLVWPSIIGSSKSIALHFVLLALKLVWPCVICSSDSWCYHLEFRPPGDLGAICDAKTNSDAARQTPGDANSDANTCNYSKGAIRHIA